VLVSCAVCAPILPKIKEILEEKAPMLKVWLTTICSAVLLLASSAALVGESYNPFLYFRF